MLSARSSRRKLNGLLLNAGFCSFTIFHCLITNLIISKDFSFGLYFQLPLIKVEAHFSGEHYQNLLTLYETMYVHHVCTKSSTFEATATRNKRNPQKAYFSFICQPVHIRFRR